MLISDIARFIIVYIVLLVGFATSMFVLFESAKSGQEGLDFEAMDATNALRLADLGSVTFPPQKRTDVAEFPAWRQIVHDVRINFLLPRPGTCLRPRCERCNALPKNPDSFQTRNQVMRKMLYISLGEVGSLDLEMTLPIQITIYFVWVVLTNVLLLNLLISMMGQTFSDNTQDTHNAWVCPVANFILRCETHILSRRWRQATRCGKRGSVAKVMRPSLCFMCPCSKSDCTLHCCLCARWWYF
jgi:hypothetical protein